MITPRTTRLVRAPDLHTFRNIVVDLACDGSPLDARDRLIVVPTRAAASYLLRAIESRRHVADGAIVLPDMVTRDELVPRLAERLPGPPPLLLTGPERDVLAGVACRIAVDEGHQPPFKLRPGLVAEIVRFYDSLQANLKDVDAFERLVLGALEPAAMYDRGAERLVRQTRFLVAAFRHFCSLRDRTGRADVHTLRSRLIDESGTRPWRHIVLCVGDYASDRHGLMPAHWDLLARVPKLTRIDLVATDGSIAGAFHERVHQLLPGIEECRVAPEEMRADPVLLVPPGESLAHTVRDREEEVAGFARWVREEVRRENQHSVSSLERMALIVRRPLPYVYLAREVLRTAGIPVQMFDALPLASEPFAAALDLVMAFVTGNFARGPAVALLRSPHFTFGPRDAPLTDCEVSALDRALSEAGYLGDLGTLEHMVVRSGDGEGLRRPSVARATEVMVEIARTLAPLRSPAPCAEHLGALHAFLLRYESRQIRIDALTERHLRGRGAIFEALSSLRSAYAQFDRRDVDFDEASAVLRRWIDAHTFAPRTGEAGVHLVDADSARFGDFDAVQLAGLIEGEWPDTPHRNIFYSQGLLRELGWPSEADRLDGIRSSFNDLLRLPASQVVVSSFALEDDAVVTASTLVDAVPQARLETRECVPSSARIFEYEALGLDPVETSHIHGAALASANRRIAYGDRRRSGETAGHDMSTYSLSGLERYQDCPFKFFAAEVLKLEEPPEDEPMLSPRARGRFVHEVFQRFFEAWDGSGRGTITVERVDEARTMFEQIAEPLLARFSESEASLERVRLFGSAASIGVVDVVLGLEASREAPVVARQLEHRFEGHFSLGCLDAPRIPIKGVADRIDLLDGHRLRVIDYKSGHAPQPKRALQVPVYALCAQEQMTERDGLPWKIDEASYVAFSGRRPLLQIIKPGGGDSANALSTVRARVVDIVNAIVSGRFPPNPYELRICSYCAYPSVCRKDYVGDE